jgi:hypothetical protein
LIDSSKNLLKFYLVWLFKKISLKPWDAGSIWHGHSWTTSAASRQPAVEPRCQLKLLMSNTCICIDYIFLIFLPFIWSFLPKWCVLNWLHGLSCGSRHWWQPNSCLDSWNYVNNIVFMASCNIRSDVIFVTVTYFVVIYLVYWSTWSICIFTFMFILFAIGCWLGGYRLVLS